MEPEWIAIGIAITGTLFGGGGLIGLLVVAFRSGKTLGTVLGKIQAVEKAVNGPLHDKLESVVESNKETWEALTERAGMCARHDAGIESLSTSVAKIEKHIESQRCVGQSE